MGYQININASTEEAKAQLSEALNNMPQGGKFGGECSTNALNTVTSTAKEQGYGAHAWLNEDGSRYNFIVE
ncbi:hypothetical protein G7B40_031280 [Aetokthonos hydrillicola Thurmond2011]|jgi:hypothetical protein|uniref:Uncharacterized protein n=1 Tax=Aetokthonos hydrillicola Thurmond2011 TaxID=2712845 RepID=A0AAP5IG05_9CYAN|nr:hypothetical protein [Aetokthonos hydrillicola]MBO3463257.1 hypothetical protein [Aetokthonos hydrillicola CCALA 1050]MBW4590518.1 hypothetical protein [Aetokthonos hydrillicola CCALA 1050]MDR9899008.1 hypothetical protein [Aetokthonos hydrillicola Thurmond2011]